MYFLLLLLFSVPSLAKTFTTCPYPVIPILFPWLARFILSQVSFHQATLLSGWKPYSSRKSENHRGRWGKKSGVAALTGQCCFVCLSGEEIHNKTSDPSPGRSFSSRKVFRDAGFSRLGSTHTWRLMPLPHSQHPSAGLSQRGQCAAVSAGLLTLNLCPSEAAARWWSGHRIRRQGEGSWVAISTSLTPLSPQWGFT